MFLPPFPLHPVYLLIPILSHHCKIGRIFCFLLLVVMGRAHVCVAHHHISRTWLSAWNTVDVQKRLGGWRDDKKGGREQQTLNHQMKRKQSSRNLRGCSSCLLSWTKIQISLELLMAWCLASLLSGFTYKIPIYS